jgi:hypothetical protein
MTTIGQRSLPPLIRLTLFSSGEFIWINPLTISYLMQEDVSPKGKITIVYINSETSGWSVHETPNEVLSIISDAAKEYESYA